VGKRVGKVRGGDGSGKAATLASNGLQRKGVVTVKRGLMGRGSAARIRPLRRKHANAVARHWPPWLKRGQRLH